MRYNDFLSVIGPAGCGKSSLLYSLMDETTVIKGNKVVKGKIAYVE